MKSRVFLACLLGALLAACSAPQTRLLRAQPVSETAPVQIPDVPFFPQEEHQCGPAALATVLSFAGKDVSPAILTDKVYVPERKGSFALEMAAAVRSEGRLAYPVAPDLGALLAALEQGYPVLVLQNNGLALYPVWHFAVVVGADRQQEKLWLRSGKTERLEISFSTFERTWARADYWGLLVFDPARLPDSLDAKPVIRELALMQQAGAVAAAQAGFSRSLLNWPEQKMAWLGLAQTSLALGDKDLAESTLRELVRREPMYGPGLNNLADLLFQKGRAREALPYAERAVAVMDVPQTRNTLAAIQTALSPLRRDEVPVQIPLRRPDAVLSAPALPPAP